MTEHVDLDLSVSWQKVHATREDLQLVRLSVLQAAHGLSALALSVDPRRPSLGTPAEEWLESDANWTTSEGSTHIANVLGGIRTICLAAADHMEVLEDSVQRGRATVTVWTLTRSVLESLGRVNYLLDSENVRELLSRHVALIRGEMKYGKHSTHIIRNVGLLDVDGYVADLEAMVQEVGGSKVRSPSYTELATNLLEAAAPDNGSRTRYSQLSGVAHGELSALQMFLTTEGFVLPRNLLVEAAAMVSAACVLVGDKLREVATSFGSQEAARWTAARDRAIAAALALQPWGEPEPEDDGAAAES